MPAGAAKCAATPRRDTAWRAGSGPLPPGWLPRLPAPAHRQLTPPAQGVCAAQQPRSTKGHLAPSLQLCVCRAEHMPCSTFARHHRFVRTCEQLLQAWSAFGLLATKTLCRLPRGRAALAPRARCAHQAPRSGLQCATRGSPPVAAATVSGEQCSTNTVVNTILRPDGVVHTVMKLQGSGPGPRKLRRAACGKQAPHQAVEAKATSKFPALGLNLLIFAGGALLMLALLQYATMPGYAPSQASPLSLEDAGPGSVGRRGLYTSSLQGAVWLHDRRPPPRPTDSLNCSMICSNLHRAHELRTATAANALDCCDATVRALRALTPLHDARHLAPFHQAANPHALVSPYPDNR